MNRKNKMDIGLVSTLIGAIIALFSAYAMFKLQDGKEKKKEKISVVEKRIKTVEDYISDSVEKCSRTFTFFWGGALDSKFNVERDRLLKELEESIYSKKYVLFSLMILEDKEVSRLIKELHEEQSNLYNLLNSIQKMINRSLIKPNDLEGLLFKAAHTIEKIRQLYGELMYGIDKYRLKKV
jgi:hypothetical protein